MPESPVDLSRAESPARFNLATALIARRLEAGDGDRVVYRCPDRAWTFAEVAALSDAVARTLRELGVRDEDRVLMAVPDAVEGVATFLGTLLAGAVAVPCNTFLGPHDYAAFLDQSRARVLVTTSALLGALEPIVAMARTLDAVLVVDADGDDGRVRAWTRWVRPTSHLTTIEGADTHRDAAAFWLWTSGSTGVPKAAVHAHQDWPWCCEGFGVSVLGLRPADHIFSAAKLFHAYGLGNSLAFPWWTGASASLLPGRATPEAVVEVLQRDRPTVFMAVPTLYAALLPALAAAPHLTAAMRLAVSAGEALPPDLYVRWRAATGVELLDAPGSTEVLHCYLSPRPGDVTPGSVGRPVPGYAMRIVDEHGHDVPVGSIGELLVSGQSTATHYWQRRDQTAAKMRGPWFASGDRYRVDEQGRYWHIGRADDMFKVSGEWVSATEVEAALASHPSVVECAVVPQADAAGILKPRAVVVLAAGVPADDTLPERLRRHVRERLAGYKVPRVVDFVPDLPKTATGKIQRFKLRR
jgi:benzoate-CoA ligase family protein